MPRDRRSRGPGGAQQVISRVAWMDIGDGQRTPLVGRRRTDLRRQVMDGFALRMAARPEPDVDLVWQWRPQTPDLIDPRRDLGAASVHARVADQGPGRMVEDAQ